MLLRPDTGSGRSEVIARRKRNAIEAASRGVRGGYPTGPDNTVRTLVNFASESTGVPGATRAYTGNARDAWDYVDAATLPAMVALELGGAFLAPETGGTSLAATTAAGMGIRTGIRRGVPAILRAIDPGVEMVAKSGRVLDWLNPRTAIANIPKFDNFSGGAPAVATGRAAGRALASTGGAPDYVQAAINAGRASRAGFAANRMQMMAANGDTGTAGTLSDVVEQKAKKAATTTEDVKMVPDAVSKRIASLVKAGLIKPEIQDALESPLPVTANQEEYTKTLLSQLGDAPVVTVKGKATKKDLANNRDAIVVSTNADGSVSMKTPPVFVDDRGVPHYVHNYPAGVRNAATPEDWQSGMKGYFDEKGDLKPEVRAQMESNLASMFAASDKRGGSPVEWYPFFNEHLVKDLSEKTNMPEWQISGVLAALSPQTPWPTNIADAVDLIKTVRSKTPKFSQQSLAAFVQTLDAKKLALPGSEWKTGAQSGNNTMAGLLALAGLGTPADRAIGKTSSFQWDLFDPTNSHLRTVGGPNAQVITSEGVPVSNHTFDIMMDRAEGGTVINPGDLPRGGLVRKNNSPYNEPLGTDARKWAGLSGVAGSVLSDPRVASGLKRRKLKGGPKTIQSEAWTQEQLMAALLRSILGYGGGYELAKYG